MPEDDTTLKQKTSELETAVDETRRELSQVDEAHRKEGHRELVAICKEATEWLEQRAESRDAASGDEAASLAQQAETFLRDLRMRRNAL